jgi:predicted Zn finger-like uncharacterized protein
MKRSPSLADKLSARLAPDVNVIDTRLLISGATSLARFDSQQEFAHHLTEGNLLNVSVIASKALSIPNGDYMVWMTDAGHTMLVPTSARPKNREVYEQTRDGYEVLTRDLMANWNKLERVLAEDGPPPQGAQNQQNLQQGSLQEPQAHEQNNDGGGEFENTIDASTVDRTPILRAMQDRGYTVTSLADEVGVDPPAISRILRTPKDVQGDPGGRNPSMGLASQICNALRMDPTAAFPDIFNVAGYEARNQPGNDGSGDHAHGKGGGKWTQGAMESLADVEETLEAQLSYDALCEEVGQADLPFDEFWRRAFWPAVKRITPRTSLVEFIDSMGRLGRDAIAEAAGPQFQMQCPSCEEQMMVNNEHAGKRVKCPHCQYQFPARQPSSPGGVGGQPRQQMTAPQQKTQQTPDPAAVQRRSEQMTQKIMPPVKRAFAAAMNKLKTDLQQVQTQAGADPKLAPHAWEIVNRFYNTVMQAGANYQPKWKVQDKGAKPRYDGAYQKARGDFQPAQPPPAQPKQPGPGMQPARGAHQPDADLERQAARVYDTARRGRGRPTARCRGGWFHEQRPTSRTRSITCATE